MQLYIRIATLLCCLSVSGLLYTNSPATITDKELKELLKEHKGPIIINVVSQGPQTQNNNQDSSLATQLGVSLTVSILQSYCKDALSGLFKEAKRAGKSGWGWVKEHPWYIAGGLAALGGTYYTIQLYQAFHYLEDPNLWSSWRKELSLEQLLAIDQGILGRQLIEALEMRYLDKDNPSDLFTPITRFCYDVDQEIAQLNRYESLFSLMDRLRLSYVLSSITQLQADIVQRRQRLVYLKNLSKQWIIEYNLARG